jgi:hypothetical protein
MTSWEVFRIGEVAVRSGVSIDTVRYYERRNLLVKAARTPGGYSVFTSDSINRVLFIKQAQQLGFSLSPRSSQKTRSVHSPAATNPYSLATTVS